jgi:hypothetical protein
LTKVDIINDKFFEDANLILEGRTRQMKENGECRNGAAHPPIPDGDLATIFKYFDRSDPIRLLSEAVFQLIFHGGARGNEFVAQLRRHSLVRKVVNGKAMYTLEHSIIQKNDQGGLTLMAQ